MSSTAQQRGRPFPINPLATISNSPNTVASIGSVFVWVSALVTSYGFYLLVWDKCQQAGFNWWVGQGIAIAAALASAKVTDFGLMSLLDYVLFYGLGLPIRATATKVGYGRYWSYWMTQPYRHFVLHPAIWALLLAVAVAMFWADRYAAKISANTVQNFAPQKPRKDIQGYQRDLNEQNNAALAPLTSAIEAARSRIKRAEKSVVSGNPALVKLISQGNGWAANELQKKKKAATSADQKRLDGLLDQQAAQISSNSDTKSRLISTAVRDDEKIAESNREIAALSGTSAYIFGYWMKILALAARLILIAMMFARGENLDVNGDGQIDLSDLHAYAGTQPRSMFGGLGRFFA